MNIKNIDNLVFGTAHVKVSISKKNWCDFFSRKKLTELLNSSTMFWCLTLANFNGLEMFETRLTSQGFFADLKCNFYAI